MNDCIVIGAGPAGLAAARQLQRAGLDVIVLEAGSEPGGRTRSAAIHGAKLDLGAAFFTSFYTRVLALADELDLPVHLTGVQPGHGGLDQALVVDGRFLPNGLVTMLGFLRFPLVPFSQKLRLARLLMSSAFARGLDVADPVTLALHDDESAGDWARRELGEAAYQFFVRLPFESFFLYECDAVGATFAQALLGHARSWQLLAPAGGMGEFCTALARTLDVRCGQAVSAVEWDGKGFTVHHAAGVAHAAAVVVAVPPPAMAGMRLGLDASEQTFLDAIAYAPSVRAMLGYDRERVLYPGTITPAGAALHGLSGIGSMRAWFPDRLPPGKEIVALSAAAWRSAQLLGKPADQVASQLLADCVKAGVHVPAPDAVSVLEDRHAIVRTPPGHFRATQAFVARDRNGLELAGDWLSGSTVEGAVRSGEAAAQRVAERLIGTAARA